MKSSRPQKELLGDFPYDSWERVYREHGLYELPWDQPEINPHLKSILKPAPYKGARALDLGCGTGTTSRYLVDIGYQVDAWDISPTALNRAVEVSHEYESSITYHCGNALKEAFCNNESYDLVFDLFFLHHVQDQDLGGYFEGIRRSLAISGWYVVGVFCKTQKFNVRESLYSAGMVRHWESGDIKSRLGLGFVAGEMIRDQLTAMGVVYPYIVNCFQRMG